MKILPVGAELLHADGKTADFSQNTQISNSIRIRPVGAELFHEDGQT